MKNLIIVYALALTGCATVTNGTTQAVTFHPSGVCEVVQSGEKIATIDATTTLEIKRKKDSITLDCGDVKKTYKASINAAGYTSITMIDFGLVDFLTGALWEYEEEK